MEASGRWAIGPELRAKGWGGAAIWYNRVAEMNGALTTAVLNIPLPSRYPAIMEKVYAKKRQIEEKVNFATRFNPKSTSEAATEGLNGDEQKIAYILWNAFNMWQEGDSVSTTYTQPTGNAVVDIINALFGTEGLFSMRRNDNVHPLAQLTGVGRSLIETSLRNLTYASVGGAGGALLAQISQFTGATAANFSSFLVTISMIGLTAGFILFYIVPFLPFIYFFFALGGWVKGIFEAMVGAPLWAMAHLRIDGNGLSGQAALSGYYLIFEVFLRPILIVFGLLASISIFSAMVSVMNQVFDLVVANTGGFDVTAELTGIGASKIAEMRSAIDKFFFTVIYTIIVYLMGMSSFKLVDLIPNNILRWMGQAVATFGDQREDIGQSLVGSSTVGAQQTLGSIGGGLQGLASLGKRA
jgi:conjugal transfer/type IV secretion protein DotA/TraY